MTHDLTPLRTIASTGSPLGARRASTTSMPTSRKTSASPPSPAAPTSSPASCWAIRRGRSGAARSRRAGSGLQVEVWDDDGQAGGGREGRARLHRALSLACRSDSGTIPTGRNTSSAYFDALPQCLVPWRLCRADRAWRADHLRPLRRDAESRRRAHRHGGDLPPGRAAARGAPRASSSARIGKATCASCSSCGCRRAMFWTRR